MIIMVGSNQFGSKTYVYISQFTSIIKFEWKLSLFANTLLVYQSFVDYPLIILQCIIFHESLSRQVIKGKRALLNKAFR